jgi:hypothetical protein
MQTHVSENWAEIAWVKELFPDRKGYLDVYDHHKLCRPRAVFGHGVHLTDDEMHCMHRTGSAISHCPTSNFFLGSGFFNVARAMRKDRPVRVGLGTDLRRRRHRADRGSSRAQPTANQPCSVQHLLALLERKAASIVSYWL